MKCIEPASYRFTWPGEDEKVICEKHVVQLRSVAAGMGMHLQTIPLTDDEESQELICCQK